MRSELRIAGWPDRFLYALGRRRAVRVSGSSMEPTLTDDDVVLIQISKTLHVGDIVLASHPFRKSVTMLKRIASVDPNGRFELRGDNPSDSTDSRTFGSVAIEYIEGKAICRLK